MEAGKSKCATDGEVTMCENCWLSSFSPLSDSQSRFKEVILQNKCLKEYDKGDVFLNSGDFVNGVYCIQEGIVKISKKGNKEKEFVLWIAGPGDIVGLNSFVNEAVFSFSATAVNKVNACFIPSSDLKVLLDLEPLVFVKLMRKVCEKLNYVEERITSISQKKIKEQCAEILISIANQTIPEKDKMILINYPIKDLANLVGTTKSYLYKILSDMVSKKILSVYNRRLVINDLSALSSIAMGNEI